VFGNVLEEDDDAFADVEMALSNSSQVGRPGTKRKWSRVENRHGSMRRAKGGGGGTKVKYSRCGFCGIYGHKATQCEAKNKFGYIVSLDKLKLLNSRTLATRSSIRDDDLADTGVVPPGDHIIIQRIFSGRTRTAL
jgi:hypothetical protein